MESHKGFSYNKTPYRFVSYYKNNCWTKGRITKNNKIVLNESAAVLQYCQQCFEGLKAYYTKKGKIVVFRPDLNFERMNESALRMGMPGIPKEMFYEAINKVVIKNKKYIPNFESNGALYLRPYMIGTTPILGVKAAKEYEFRVFASPVYPYFGNEHLLNLTISDFDRASPNGTGHIKVGLNYAMSIYAISKAHENGFDENLYLDSKSRTYIEETGGANILFINKNNELVTPLSDTILPSITRKSIIYIAKNMLNMNVIERKINVNELGEFKECGLCGTAAIISFVGSINDHGKVSSYSEHTKLAELKNILTSIQKGEIEAPKDWLPEIK